MPPTPAASVIDLRDERRCETCGAGFRTRLSASRSEDRFCSPRCRFTVAPAQRSPRLTSR